MYIEKCKSYDGGCPCLVCEKLAESCESDCDTDHLCDKARKYCEEINIYGRKENASSL